jgi:isoleucyl-tRNA synthetase
MDYKDSLLLPKTSFPMRGNLPQNEPKKYKQWDDENMYDKMKDNREDASQSFTFHDGPPYANGNIHIGHVLNKVLKDIIVKYHYFLGKKVYFTPGWDCHGLPIEHQVEKKIGGAKKKLLSKSKLRSLCREHALKFVDIQKQSFKNLGIIADFNRPYLTLENKFEANIYRELCKIANKGLLIERSKPVHWSWAAQTALAEAEIEYKDKESHSIYVAFKLQNSDKSIIIWTTTPWTLPVNQGIVLGEDIEYISTTDGFIVAKNLFTKLKDLKVIKGDIDTTILAKELENTKAINPLNDRESLIMLGDFVSIEDGTGAVHTAPAHGEDDYKMGLKYNIDIIVPVNEFGCYDEDINKYKLFKDTSKYLGKNVLKCNEDILEDLGESLLLANKIIHSYPHCWRTKKPIIFRATKQFFVTLDKPYTDDGKTLREKIVSNLDSVRFYPEVGKNRLLSMVNGRPDWCISRQRDWGVPIAFFRIIKTKELILDEKVLNYIAMIFDMHGADAWYDMEIKELLYPGCKYKAEDLEKVNDILDVWFDSGSTWSAVLQSRDYDAGNFPADLYLEGSDQHRGWFQSSLLVSSATKEIAPYKNIITHGFTMDANGRKMSKSEGNVLEPDKISKEFGSEILRLWVAMSDYQNDQKISPSIIKQIAEQYRKLRNTFRFLLANTNDLEKIVSFDEMKVFDKWFLSLSAKTFKEVSLAFENYDFAKGLNKINNFLVNDLSGLYLDVTKDRLYCDPKNSASRISSMSVMSIIAKTMISLLAPILTYTMDEILEHAGKTIKEDNNDIFDYENFKLKEIKSKLSTQDILEARSKFSELVDMLKKDKIIKSTLELDLKIQPDLFGGLLDKKDKEDLFIVSNLIEDTKEKIINEFEVNGSKFTIYKSSGCKCPRCWKFNASKEDALCDRCEKSVNA